MTAGPKHWQRRISIGEAIQEAQKHVRGYTQPRGRKLGKTTKENPKTQWKEIQLRTTKIKNIQSIINKKKIISCVAEKDLGIKLNQKLNTHNSNVRLLLKKKKGGG